MVHTLFQVRDIQEFGSKDHKHIGPDSTKFPKEWMFKIIH